MAGKLIAAIVGAESTLIQKLLVEAVSDWRRAGLTVCGVVEEAAGRSCSGFLRNLETGAEFAMYLDEPPVHTSCHLDELGVVDACASVVDRVAASDLVVLSKFGKLEAVGSGLFEAFETAIALGKPVLTSVAPKHHYAWQRFAPEAVFIGAGRASIEAWKRGVPAFLHRSQADGMALSY
ncbi:DUF2478 domain-containing protein [Mesorhizobium sp. CU2]|uniref:DUF2478 domain-containing protein n=1 Tax=unclassified Mesorhizobium TaxID=325217 RepID=UPI0011290998|nr:MULTISPECIES: DUF2478 domain-containing protein [unclassified Mesorhizobium]TPN77559.1 DUF2478 domain-containing protein [Mesorhizobium sp. CU3]TPO16580.1 DUF2478 domain-containing protein [Mesorhizobium sp. CU2]